MMAKAKRKFVIAFVLGLLAVGYQRGLKAQPFNIGCYESTFYAYFEDDVFGQYQQECDAACNACGFGNAVTGNCSVTISWPIWYGGIYCDPGA